MPKQKKRAVLPLVLLAGISALSCSSAYADVIAIREVKAGDTLYRMCEREYGRCTEHLIKAVRDLNPRIRNLNLIKKGDRIKFPLVYGRVQKASPATAAVVAPAEAGALPVAGQQDLVVTTQPRVIEARAGKSDGKFNQYPDLLVGEISELKWLSDNTAMVSGKINLRPGDDNVFTFVVSVEGDLDYPQDLQIAPDGKFVAFASIGRPFDDYGRTFNLKLIQSHPDSPDRQISVPVRKEKNNKATISFNKQQTFDTVVGTAGIDKWLKEQSVETGQLDNSRFKANNGLVIKNYRFLNVNPDEKYLGRYGRVTLYGSSTIAKYLIVKGDVQTAKKILDVWCNLLDENGGVPRSANVVGDSYISPDVRTGDVAYFLGALALYKAATAGGEYDGTIRKLLFKYFKPLQDPLTGLVRGGYSTDSNGYSNGGKIDYVSWASSEHNFDLFQALVLLSKLTSGEEQKAIVEFYTGIGKGLDTYMWDKENNTFNRGYRFGSGPDKARALDCSSWGALYLLKQATLAAEARDAVREDFYMRRASTALDFIDKHYKSTWCYTTPEGKKGCISGYKPYAGIIDDVQDDATHIPIDWDKISDLVWSEGTLGVAIAHYQMWCKKASGMDCKNCERFYDILDQMLELQSLGKTGGLLYTSKRIEGHFTQGEELASLAWLGYALIIKGNEFAPGIGPYRKWIPW